MSFMYGGCACGRANLGTDAVQFPIAVRPVGAVVAGGFSNQLYCFVYFGTL